MGRITVSIIRVVAVVGWLVLIWQALPGPDLDTDLALLAMPAAGAGSIILALARCERPVNEVYQMGFEAGQRAAKIEAATTPNVVPMRQRPGAAVSRRLG